MSLPKLIRKTAFQRAFAFSGLIAVLMILLVGFIYWQTVAYLEEQIDLHLLTDARALCAEPGPQVSARLLRALTADNQHMRVGAIFDPAGRTATGNLKTPPAPLPPDDTVGPVGDPLGMDLPGKGTVRVARLSLPDGSFLVFGRRVGELDSVNHIVSRAIALAVAPLICLALGGGVLLSRHSVRRIRAVEQACRRIVSGRFDERLPLRRSKDELHALSVTVNEMLDETERLMGELKSAGDAIAHDLRTPLTRLGARLDRVLRHETDLEGMRTVVGKALADVNQLVAMTRAMLRLGEIESGHRRAGFKTVDVVGVAASVADFYSPIAEEREILFSVRSDARSVVNGDGDLIFEALANVVDNAVKFTSRGGEVKIEVRTAALKCLVRVSDTGPGIPEAEHSAVLRRFYRIDGSRRTMGAGLGLTIVSAIVRLHGGELRLGRPDAGDGLLVEFTLPASGRSSLA